jgi:hypothetical protein
MEAEYETLPSVSTFFNKIFLNTTFFFTSAVKFPDAGAG